MGHDIDSAAERAHTAAIRDHAARLIDGSEAYPFDCDDYCAVVELCDDHDAALDRLEAVEAERDRLTGILAVERGDESEAPEGWRPLGNSTWVGPGASHVIRCLGGWEWIALADALPFGAQGTTPTALEAMEAADAARGGEDG